MQIYFYNKYLLPARFITKVSMMTSYWINKFKYSHQTMGNLTNKENHHSHKQNYGSFVPLNFYCLSHVQVNYNIISNKQNYGYDRT